MAGKAELTHYNNKALDEIVKFCSPFDVLLLDEALCAVNLNVLSEEKLASFLEHKPRGLEVILTGHEASDRLVTMADYVTLMTKIHHHTRMGSRQGRALNSNFLNICKIHDTVFPDMLYYVTYGVCSSRKRGERTLSMENAIKNYEDVDSWKTIMFLYTSALK